LKILDGNCGDSFTLRASDIAAIAFIIPSGTALITMHVKQAGLSGGSIAIIVILVLLIAGGGFGYTMYKKK
jgi:hypothetical protein